MRADATAYRWCGLTLASDLDLPELPRADEAGAASHWRVSIGRGPAPRQPGRRWFHHWQFPDGRRWLSFARQAGGYLLRFPRLCDFEIREATREILCYRPSRVPLRTLRHLLLDQVLPLTAGGRDRLALHASVVAVDGRAVAFLGAAGHGKSTLAAELARRGAELVSDDCCLLRRSSGGFEVVPSYPGVRLSPDSVRHLFGASAARGDRVSHYSAKRRVSPRSADARFCDGPVPLGRVFVLAPIVGRVRGAGITIAPRPARESLVDLLRYCFYLDVQHAGRVKEAFELAGDVAAAHRVATLTFPWNLAAAGALADRVIEELKAPILTRESR